jgi:putative oxidoreductase
VLPCEGGSEADPASAGKQDAVVNHRHGPALRGVNQVGNDDMNDAFVASWAPRLLSVLRIVAALIFLFHGTQKLFGFPPLAPNAMPPAVLSLSWIAAVLELILGSLMLVGLFTRVSAFVASGEMAFAYFIAHAPRNLFPTLNGGDAAILYCFVFLYIAAAGAGPWSLDALWRRPAAVREPARVT